MVVPVILGDPSVVDRNVVYNHLTDGLGAGITSKVEKLVDTPIMLGPHVSPLKEGLLRILGPLVEKPVDVIRAGNINVVLLIDAETGVVSLSVIPVIFGCAVSSTASDVTAITPGTVEAGVLCCAVDPLEEVCARVLVEATLIPSLGITVLEASVSCREVSSPRPDLESIATGSV